MNMIKAVKAIKLLITNYFYASDNESDGFYKDYKIILKVKSPILRLIAGEILILSNPI